jgi:hypothetical protein
MVLLDKRPSARGGIPVALVVVVAVAVVGLAVLLFLNARYQPAPPQAPVLTPEARAYVRGGYLKLSDVTMGAKESFGGQQLVEILGKITNDGDRVVKLVEINCVFYDPYSMVVLRQRVPIVSAKMGGLKPAETKSFRLPFDTLPDSWNQTLPQLVIAQIQFQ